MLLRRPKVLRDHTSIAFWLFVLAAIWLSVIAVMLWRGFMITPSIENAITTIVVERHNRAGDGRAFHIQIGENARHEARVVLIEETSNLRPGSYPSSFHLASETSLVPHDPPDPTQSGIWIDGRRRQLSELLMVVYVSDKLPATQIAIPLGQQRRFLEEARSSDGFAFITKWIEPRLADVRAAANGR